MRAKNLTSIYQAIFFDLDGTLIDSAHTFSQLLNQLRAQCNLAPLAAEEVRTATAAGANALVTLAYGVGTNDEKFPDYKKIFLDTYKQFLTHDSSPYFPGITEVLELINERRIPWGIITNKHQEFTQLVLLNQPLLATANIVVSGDSLPLSKPHPDPIFHACAQLAILPTQVIFIGDHLNDIQAGKNAGTTTGLALYGYLNQNDQPLTWGADHYFSSAADIHKYLIQHI